MELQSQLRATQAQVRSITAEQCLGFAIQEQRMWCQKKVERTAHLPVCRCLGVYKLVVATSRKSTVHLADTAEHVQGQRVSDGSTTHISMMAHRWSSWRRG